MELPYIFAISLSLGSSVNAIAGNSVSGKEAERSYHEVTVQCTSVALAYIVGEKPKTTISKNCLEDNHDANNGDQSKSDDHRNIDARAR